MWREICIYRRYSVTKFVDFGHLYSKNNVKIKKVDKNAIIIEQLRYIELLFL